jgi:predicted nuclease with TOPRIM domain
MNFRQYFRISLRDLFLLMLFCAGLFALEAHHRGIEARYRAALQLLDAPMAKILASDDDIRAKVQMMKAENTRLKADNERLKEANDGLTEKYERLTKEAEAIEKRLTKRQ